MVGSEIPFPVVNIDPLKQKLTEIDAATLRDFILDLYLHHPELSDQIEALLLYNDPAALAKAFEKADCNLAATACYRALLLDILTQVSSNAYGHVARYFKKLEALAGQIKAFKPLLEHHAFLQQLQSAHGQKRSFWARLKPW